MVLCHLGFVVDGNAATNVKNKALYAIFNSNNL
jgi:hypothetical protein